MRSWQETRHQVAIADTVLLADEDGTEKPIRGARVEITDKPLAFNDFLDAKAIQFGSRWAAMLDRPDRAQSAPDGLFYFLDLPDGEYTLKASLPGPGGRYGTAEERTTVTSKVVENDVRDKYVTFAEGRHEIEMALVKLVIQPTTIKGKITAPALPVKKSQERNTGKTTGAVQETAVTLAEVRVKGSGERAFSDAQGQYVLAGVEPGQRTVLVFAQGYRPAFKAIVLEGPGVTKNLPILLARETG
ncbi:MAG: hypothetical protein ACLQOO_21190 [Terriglobia bacterium]